MAVVGAIGLGAAVVSAVLFFFTPVQPAASTAPPYYSPDGLNEDFFAPGIRLPATEPAGSAAVRDNESVVGVSVGGHDRAYRLWAMCGRTVHVVNDVIDRVPVTVTYCNRRNCVRAFTMVGEPDEPLDGAVRGLQDGKMRISINDEVFLQEAEVVPVERLEVEVTTWKEWKAEHPETDIYVGDGQSYPPEEVDLKNFSYSSPGIRMPGVTPGCSAQVTDAAEVIGVSVNGHYRAYRVSAMFEPKVAVIDDMIDGIPVTLTYNRWNGYARGFTATGASQGPLDIGLRGWQDGTLLLDLDGVVLPQDSDEIPLARLETRIMTWKDWKTAHPETDIFTGMYVETAGMAD